MARRRTSLNTVFALILFLAVAVVVLSWAPSLRRPVAAHFMLPDPGPIRLGDPIVYQGEEIGEIVNVNRTEDGAAITGRVEGAHRDVLDEEYYVRVLADRSLIGVTGVELLTGPGAAVPLHALKGASAPWPTGGRRSVGPPTSSRPAAGLTV
jgi:hypothetical protein